MPGSTSILCSTSLVYPYSPSCANMSQNSNNRRAARSLSMPVLSAGVLSSSNAFMSHSSFWSSVMVRACAPNGLALGFEASGSFAFSAAFLLYSSLLFKANISGGSSSASSSGAPSGRELRVCAWTRHPNLVPFLSVTSLSPGLTAGAVKCVPSTVTSARMGACTLAVRYRSSFPSKIISSSMRVSPLVRNATFAISLGCITTSLST